MTLFIGILEEGLIYAIMALGVYITYKILDFPDLSVDSTFPMGAALTASAILAGINPVLTLFLAFGAGALAGFVLACGVVVLRVLLDDTYKSAEEIRKYTGMVVLASVPLVGGTEPKKGSNFQRRMKRLSKDICRRVGGKAGRNA